MTPTANIAPNSIPADWLALGAEEGYHPKEVQDLLLWVAGPTGEGKSTFTRSIPNGITLDFADETGGVLGPRSPRINIRNYDHYMEITDKLIKEGKNGGKHWGRVVFDNAEDWVSMIIEVLQKEKNTEDITEYGQKGKGYALIRNRCWSRIQQLHDAGYVWSVNANLVERQQTVGNTTTTVIRPVVFPGFYSMFGTRSDFKLVVYARNRSVTKYQKIKLPNGPTIDKPIGEETKKVYFCNCRSNDTQEAKTRGVPDMEETFELPLIDGWKTFAKKYNEARDKALAKSEELKEK